ncbi:hypothetical protein OU426_11465 [Frigidibacter sp. RF13]|uniref:acyl-homoserine-lactone synthase n=1 Tax=Frigidibacter sp. RF13 TaxID=2997340 RepID=UPI00226E9B37|nr:acyl-homoserine-lactone synthase [Frigidibacter sp. RF13]MCY1127474.1 hypothetical protein [Frigidibacter sp. RF13]
MSFLDLIFSLAGAFAVQTLFDLSEPLSRRLVRLACRLLPKELRALRQEQMEADLLHVNGSALRIVTAIGFVKLILPEALSHIASKPSTEATTMLTFENLHKHGELFANMFRARERFFVAREAWNLPVSLSVKYDQYDNPASKWIAIHSHGKVLGGMRLTPTTARCGIYSYMIRDAQRGLLQSCPASLLFKEAPIESDTWELSHWFVTNDMRRATTRRARKKLFLELPNAAKTLGANRIVTFQPIDWIGKARRRGLTITAIGDAVEIEGKRMQAVEIRFTDNPNDEITPTRS